MTSSAAGSRSRSGSQGEEFLEWLGLHSTQVVWAAIGAGLVAAGIWFYFKSHEAQSRNASAALSEAEQALNSGNLPLAQSDLEKVVGRYESTEAGKVARVLLAQVHYQKGEYARGIEALRPLSAGDDRYFAPGALALAGAGYEQLHKWVEAADCYRQAAARAPFESNRDTYLAAEARTLLLAGKTAEARAVWSRLAADPGSTAAAEARVRLGELEAKPIS